MQAYIKGLLEQGLPPEGGLELTGDFAALGASLEELAGRYAQLYASHPRASNSLEQAQSLLTALTDSTEDLILVYSQPEEELLFQNPKALTFSLYRSFLYNQLIEKSKSPHRRSVEKAREIHILDPNGEIQDLFFESRSFPMEWRGKPALAYLISDKTSQRQKENNILQMAYTDSLTKAYNRHYFMLSLQDFVARRIPFSICYIDLDNLKGVNDQHGHASGDDYILAVCKLLYESFRQEDIICRIGGDEFAVLLKECDADFAQSRNHLANQRLQELADSAGYSMSYSYGVLYVGPDNQLDAEAILDAVDQRMYKHKNAKREP